MQILKRFEKLSKSFRSVMLSFLTQFSNSILSFIMIPILLGYLNKEDYGLWVTLVSLVSWIFVSDFGIGQAFRNRVTSYLADGDKKALNRHFRITFQYYCILGIAILAFFVYLLNTNEVLQKNKDIALIIYLPYIIYFPFSLGTQILQGLRLVHVTGILTLSRAALWAIFVGILVLTEIEENLILISIGYSAIQTFINLITIYIAGKKSDIKLPTKKEFLSKLVYDNTILVGIRFFVLQLSNLILYTMGNYFVYSNLTPTSTAIYDTINRVFTLYMTFFNIIITVFWSEIAFLRETGDFIKLQLIYKKLLTISMLFAVGSLLVVFMAPWFIQVWTQGKINITTIDCIPFAFLVSVQAIAYTGTVFLNAFEKINTQVIISVVSIIIIYPLIKLGFKYELGIAAVPIVCGILVLPILLAAHLTANQLIKSHGVINS
ncbi:lipopolysaccharide biosynthesis protein [Dyadobacter psychrotolerans]|uniref:Polysaccharide biosynthesis protein n=1 Tax=Dyadobacter psychrotolerans TaxID=2541721 RepID=A0A4R5DM70_9BACT|nr:oligosaccharide flippase family protein [Dyadobacter psychrotolerans]TDE13140.1 hypothetical protein E0F88_18955 [Dyadobacter psychrotolerans]